MNFEKLKELKVSVDTFDDASFVSLLNENEAIIQNLNDKSLWSLPFSEQEESFVFHPNKGYLLENVEADEQYSESISEINKNILIALKESDDQSYQDSLKDLLKFFDPSKKRKDKINEDQEDFIYEGTRYDLLNEEEQEWVKSFQSKWSDKLESVREKFLNFRSIGSIFNENNEMKDDENVSNPIELLLSLQESILNKELLMENIQFVCEWKDRVSQHFKVSIIEGINPFDSDWKVKILKNILQYKKEVEDISVNETVKLLSEIHNEVFEQCDTIPVASDSATPSGGGYDGENKLHFLKMSGTFSNKDVENLIKDFDYALGSWNNKDQDELQAISSMKDKAEYMYRTNMIDDELISSLINSFNMKYGRDGRDLYRSPDNTSGSVISRKMTPEISLPLAV